MSLLAQYRKVEKVGLKSVKGFSGNTLQPFAVLPSMPPAWLDRTGFTDLQSNAGFLFFPTHRLTSIYDLSRVPSLLLHWPARPLVATIPNIWREELRCPVAAINLSFYDGPGAVWRQRNGGHVAIKMSLLHTSAMIERRDNLMSANMFYPSFKTENFTLN